ncbi:MAG: hypothetical protein M1831_001473 [Alyxoria varia]|nr:MAG: hypothetical protein M1831_001473 [Alyxoria varia]
MARCGALAQTVQSDEAGYFSLNRASVKRFLEPKEELSQVHRERDQHFARALEHADIKLMRSLGGREGAEVAPRKEAIDKLMPYFRETLRQAIGRSARDARLGNVMCVSSKRGWWTKELKSQIWQHGGGGWMVGKANVGKSNLFEVAFPKGSEDDVNFDRLREEARHVQPAQDEPHPVGLKAQPDGDSRHAFLLPPAREESLYPAMPTVSSLPGTTASPIRIPFGKNKGELVDLPGLERSNLGVHVLPEYRQDMILKSRIVPEQQTIKPGQSLVLGGLIRLKPLTDSLVFLAYPFVPLKTHVTSESKLKAVQSDEKAIPPQYQVDENTWKGLSPAGTFQLKWDVTKQRAGPLTSKSVANFKPEQLPFKVLSADILIESLGWVELVVQVRRKDYEPNQEIQDAPDKYPAVEVSSPNGKYIGVRSPMGAWILNKKKAKKPGRRTIRRRR